MQPTSVRWSDPELRNRALVLLALLALCPLALQMPELPTRIISANVLGSALSLRFSADTLLFVLMPALTCAGADWVLRRHPDVQQGEVRHLFPFWIVPGYAALALAIVLSRLNSWPLWVMVLTAGVFSIGALLLAEWFVLSPDTRGFTLARLLLTAGVYATAFALFTLIYTTRERSLISATLVVLASFGLALDLLSPHLIGLRSALLQAGVIAFLLGQAMWVLNLWNISNWSGGILLLTLFYVLVGFAQQHFQDRLTRNLLFEFGGVMLVAVLVAWLLSGVR